MEPETRIDPLSGYEVIFAPDRLARPGAFHLPRELPDHPSRCPFCSGREDQTPQEVAVYHRPAESNWRVRVIPNRYPAVADGRTISPVAKVVALGPILAESRAARGRHEVVVESPEHWTRTLDVPHDDLALVFQAYAERFRVWRQDPEIRCGVAFKNEGFDAGASLPHVHSQLVALTHPPLTLQRRWSAASDYTGTGAACYWCDVMKDESRLGVRVVQDSEFLVWCPFAARVPYEMCIAPRHHASHFELDGHSDPAAVAKVVAATLARLEKSAPGAAFNLLLHSAPFDIPWSDHYHWHIEILPRQTRLAGFEWITGSFINPVLPEDAAQLLRRARPEP